MFAYLDTSIISFSLSFLGIIGMIGFKALEIRSGKKSWITRIADNTNHKVHYVLDRIKIFFAYFNRKTALALIQWIAYHILSWARNAYIWAYKKAHSHAPSKKVIDMVRGRGEANRNGGSSFYLKSISDKNVEEMEVKK
jgi:hypothetical protein